MTWKVKPPAGPEANNEAKDYMVHDELGKPVGVCLSGRSNAEIMAQARAMWELLNQYEAMLDDVEDWSELSDFPFKELRHLRLETQSLLRLVKFPKSEPETYEPPRWDYDDSVLDSMTPEEVAAFMAPPSGVPVRFSKEHEELYSDVITKGDTRYDEDGNLIRLYVSFDKLIDSVALGLMEQQQLRAEQKQRAKGGDDEA